MTDFLFNEMPHLSINEVIETLTNSYTTIINNKVSITTFPSIMLWGQPGVGKSQAIRQIANKLEINTKKKVNITDVRLLLFNPIDLRGIPVANEEKTLAVWLKPKIFQMDESNDVINILFLDEISSAPQSVQAAAYQITLDRTVGEHKLPDNCIVIAAGNRVTDKSVAYKMPKALANRLLHFEVESDYQNWKKWAIVNNINPNVIGFLGFKENYLNTFDPAKDNLAFATPRSWEMVSNVLNNVNGDIDQMYPLICGLIGSGIAIEFRTYVKVFKKIPNIEDIANGKEVIVPKDPSIIYALCTSLTSYVSKHKNDIKSISNIIKYASNFPRDYSVMLMSDILLIDKNLEDKLFKLPEFVKWATNNSNKSSEMIHGVINK